MAGLARATGQDDQRHPDELQRMRATMGTMPEEVMRSDGMFGARVDVPAHAVDQTRRLRRSPRAGRRTVPRVQRFDDVDEYLRSSERWCDEIVELRPTLRACGLDEVVKWGKPCYVHDGRNICILQEMKDHLAVMFFKGALLSDPDGVLVDQGPNSRSARRLEITSVDDARRLAATLAAYVAEAIGIEDGGLSVPQEELVLADELQRALDEDAALASAFSGLTPGRQREYNLHVGGAKRSETRSTRVERCRDRILAGKGLRDRL